MYKLRTPLVGGILWLQLSCVFQREIERLRKEGSQTLLQEQESIRQEIINQQKLLQTSIFTSVHEDPVVYPRLRIRWKPPVTFDEKALSALCSKYGPINTLVVVNKSALIEFQKQSDAVSYN